MIQAFNHYADFQLMNRTYSLEVDSNSIHSLEISLHNRQKLPKTWTDRDKTFTKIYFKSFEVFNFI